MIDHLSLILDNKTALTAAVSAFSMFLYYDPLQGSMGTP